jgi:tRNA threonylcarbamoyladenosine biosynthesis protein TsaE
MHAFTSRSPEETKGLAHRLIQALSSDVLIRGTSTIVALQGNLGAGKTVFVKGVAENLGVTEVVTSPTFVIEKIYELPPEAHWKRLIHIDAYRLQGEDELHTIGWNDIATDPNNLIMIEWPEQVGLGVPERAIWVAFEQVDEMTRNITLEGISIDPLPQKDVPNTSNH